MLPRVILHNSVSLDGSLTGFEVDMESHYRIAGEYRPRVHLIGSNTAVAGFELFGPPPPEDAKDMKRPHRAGNLPFWAVIDTTGKLNGLLHGLRGFELCRDVILLVSGRTPDRYIEYLRDRDYRYHVAGEEHVDLGGALELLEREYGAGTVLCDTGRILGNLLLANRLVSEVSLLIHPVVVGTIAYPMFGGVRDLTGLKLKRTEVFGNGCLWVMYEPADLPDGGE